MKCTKETYWNFNKYICEINSSQIEKKREAEIIDLYFAIYLEESFISAKII